jgi:HAD superfamily hydrolase (TIGR01509 family)
MKQLEAVIFDMDGVLIDSEPIHYTIERILFAELGISVSDELHKTYLGTACDFMYQDIKTKFNLPQSLNELLEFDEQFRCSYFRNLDRLVLNEGVESLLNELVQAGVKMAVATSSSPEMALILLDRCGISSVFMSIVTTKEAGKSKPAPDVYRLAAQKIGVSSDNCLVFEDSPNGLLAAKNAEMVCVAVLTPSVDPSELTLADAQINSFKNMTFNLLSSFFTAGRLVK